MGLNLSNIKTISGRSGLQIKRVLARSNGAVLWSAGAIVTYYIDGESNKKIEEISSGDSALSPTTFTPTKSGWTFVGWRQDDAANSTVLTSKVVESDPVTLYAVFSKGVTLSYSGNGSTSGSTASQTGTAYYNNGNLVGASFTISTSGFTKTSYTFTGWTYNSTTYYPNQQVLATENMALSATWAVTAKSFNYTGGIQTFTVPATGVYQLQTYGASGGYSSTSGTYHKGGYAKGNTVLTKGTVLYIGVGGAGGNKTGGYNGGGTGVILYDVGCYAGGGGGATHIATRTGLLSALSSYKSNILIVAGGGGGGGINRQDEDRTVWGGAGGGTSGGAGTIYGGDGNGGAGATQSSGAAFGKGGNGYASDYDGDNGCKRGLACGGGGGYYGGYGGYSLGNSGSAGAAGGGGGSGYIGGLTNASMSNGARSGNGTASITLVSVSSNVVTYNMDSGVFYSEIVSQGASCLSPTTFTPTKSGYTFVGWRQDSTASGEVLSSLTMGSTPITLYAVFKRTVTLSYNGCGASGSTAAQSGTVYYNCGNNAYPTLTIAANGFTWSGYTFSCWKNSSGKSYNPGDSITISANTTLYACWPGSSYVVYTANVVENTPTETTTKSIDSAFVSVSAPGIYPQALNNPPHVTLNDKSETLTISINYGWFSRATIVFHEASSNAYTNPMGVAERIAYITYQGEATKNCGGANDINKTTTATKYSVTCSAHLAVDYGDNYTWVNSGVSIRSITLHS